MSDLAAMLLFSRTARALLLRHGCVRMFGVRIHNQATKSIAKAHPLSCPFSLPSSLGISWPCQGRRGTAIYLSYVRSAHTMPPSQRKQWAQVSITTNPFIFQLYGRLNPPPSMPAHEMAPASPLLGWRLRGPPRRGPGSWFAALTWAYSGSRQLKRDMGLKSPVPAPTLVEPRA